MKRIKILNSTENPVHCIFGLKDIPKSVALMLLKPENRTTLQQNGHSLYSVSNL